MKTSYKIISLITILLLTSSCARNMTRQEVIKASKECEDAGMKTALIVGNIFSMEITRVDCWAKEE